ncbi:hypothetical protein ABZW57_31975, partial [Streptomyces pseudogriseolus]
MKGHERGVAPDTLVSCGAIDTPSLNGRGLAGEALKGRHRHAGGPAAPAARRVSPFARRTPDELMAGLRAVAASYDTRVF